MSDAGENDFAFPYEKFLHEVAPGLHEAQNAWLAEIDSLSAPDRKTHELIRMVCTAILGSGAGVERHAMLAGEFGASWAEIVGSLLLTEPSFGISRAVEALPHARKGWNAAQELETETE